MLLLFYCTSKLLKIILNKSDNRLPLCLFEPYFRDLKYFCYPFLNSNIVHHLKLLKLFSKRLGYISIKSKAQIFHQKKNSRNFQKLSKNVTSSNLPKVKFYIFNT